MPSNEEITAAQLAVYQLAHTTSRVTLLHAWFQTITLGIDEVLVGQQVSEHAFELRVVPVDALFFQRWQELTDDTPGQQAA